MDKFFNSILVIPPNIPLTSIPSTSELPQGSHEPTKESATKSPMVEINSNPTIQEVPLTSKPLLVTSMFYRLPRKVPKEMASPTKKRKHNRIMNLAMDMDPYDILTNMDIIQPQISLR
jgi:hypothetical protein